MSSLFKLLLQHSKKIHWINPFYHWLTIDTISSGLTGQINKNLLGCIWPRGRSLPVLCWTQQQFSFFLFSLVFVVFFSKMGSLLLVKENQPGPVNIKWSDCRLHHCRNQQQFLSMLRSKANFVYKGWKLHVSIFFSLACFNLFFFSS